MILSERKLRRLIRKTIKNNQLSEAIPGIIGGPGMGGGGVPTSDQSPPPEQVASEYMGQATNLIPTLLAMTPSDIAHGLLGIMSIADPTMASDCLDSLLYSIEGDPASASLVLALSAGGLAAGAGTVKMWKVVEKARSSKALNKLEKVDPDTAKRLRKEIDNAEKSGNTEIDYAKVKAVAKARGKNMKTAQEIVKKSEEAIMKGITASIEGVGLSKKLAVIGTRKQKAKAAMMIKETTEAIADSLDSFDDIAEGLYGFSKGNNAVTVLSPDSPLGRIPHYIIDNPKTTPAMRQVTKLAQEYQFEWEEITKHAFPSGMKKGELSQAKTLFEKLKNRLYNNDHNIAKVVKQDLVDNLEVQIIADGSKGFAGNLTILDEIEDRLPGQFRLSVDVGSPSLRPMLRTTMHHEMHHAFDASAAKFIDREIAVMSPLFKEFEDLLSLTIPKNKVPLNKLSDLQKQFTNVGFRHPAENHTNIMVLKDFIDNTTGSSISIATQSSTALSTQKLGIHRFFKRYGKHPEYTKRSSSGIYDELQKRPELSSFYNDWIDVYNNPQTRDEFVEILLNYGKAPIQKSSGVSKAAAATIGTGTGKQALQDITIDDDKNKEQWWIKH